MPDKVIDVEVIAPVVTCHQCGTKNRLRQTTARGRYRCGSCQAVIHESFQQSRRWRLRFAPRIWWAIIATCIALAVFAFTAWPQFQWAAFRNSAVAYEAFLERFPSSDYSADAKERIRKLRDDDVWGKAVAKADFNSFKNYASVYPDGKHFAEAEIRIDGFYNDWNWVRASDNLTDYRRFASRFPNHSQIGWINKRIIDLEVKEIASGKYGEMPRAQPLSTGGVAVEVEVENRTGYELTVRYSGPESKKVVIPVGATEAVKLQPGDYKVAASVSAAAVTNYYGNDSMIAGKYSSNFYIETSYRGISIPSFSRIR